MTSSYRDRLFASYNETHIQHVDPADRQKLDWFREYAARNYLPHLSGVSPETARVLDIGCNKGYLLAVLAAAGYRHLNGIDLSPVDVEQARQVAPAARVECADAFAYLGERAGSFDVIFIKAVVEHVPKEGTLPLLEAIHHALKPGGMVLVDVPNMDWLFAQHERYMDFTHEAGFTRESLMQVMSNVYREVRVVPVDNIRPDLAFLARWKKRVARFVLGKLLIWADPEGGALPLWQRSILGIGRK